MAQGDPAGNRRRGQGGSMGARDDGTGIIGACTAFALARRGRALR
jgi:hypothetical protein